MDFDLTGSESAADDGLSDLYEPEDDEADTVIRELPDKTSPGTEPDPDFTIEEDEPDSEDETIMLDDDATISSGDDEHMDDEDATLRKDDI